MKKYALFTAATLLLAYYILSNNRGSPDLVQGCLGDACLWLELAKTPKDHAMGLMHRERLEEEYGMLFIFETSEVRHFWMKNTLIPLDIIWLDENKKVIGYSQAKPCEKDPCPLYSSEKKAKYVLETKKGFMEKNNIEPGETLEITI
jgi:uncharacterized protein